MTAVAVADGVDAGLAWHYGDPLGEQRALQERAGLIDRRNRGVLIVGGDDRLGWLHSICSQHLSDRADGEATQALVLSPHGHIEQHWQVAVRPGAVWLDVEPGTSADVLTYLDKMRFLKRVEPADVSADWAVLTIAGPQAGAVLVTAGLPVPVADLPTGAVVEVPDGGFVRLVSGPGPQTYDVVVPRTQADTVFAALGAAGAEPVGTWAHDAVRVASGIPRLGFETDHRTIPHEVAPWLALALHFDKGCYRGQETVARVQNLGRSPRHLVLLHLSGENDNLPAPGTAVEVAGRAAGFTGTAAHHHELGPIALAVVKRSVSGDAGPTVDGQPVSVEPVEV